MFSTHHSKAQCNHLKSAHHIHNKDLIFISLCDLCFSSDLDCYKMSEDFKLKYSECAHHDHLCIAVSWDLIDHTKVKLQFKIVFNEAEQNCLLNKLTELCTHIIHKRKVLKQTMQHFYKQMNCLVCEMKADEEVMT